MLQDLPTRTSLSIEYGFRVPERFVTVVRLALEASKDRAEFESFYEETCGLYLGPDCGYQQTPPELFPMGSKGVDGVHYGYVVHAPELERDEYPVGVLCPMDRDGVFWIGSDTRSAFENLMSANLAYQLEYGELTRKEAARLRQRIEAVSRVLDIDPKPEKAARRYGPNGSGLPVVPEVPDGWLYVPTRDGVGVLAPQEAFQSPEPTQIGPYDDPGVFVTLGQEVLDAGFPATALFHFREGFWSHWTDSRWAARFVQRMSDCYLSLSRPSLAAALERNHQRSREC